MQGTRSRDSLNLMNANTLTCLLSSYWRTPIAADLTDGGVDVGLGEDAGMGSPRCEFDTISQPVDIPTHPDPCSKGLQLQDPHPFPAQPAPCPC